MRNPLPGMVGFIAGALQVAFVFSLLLGSPGAFAVPAVTINSSVQLAPASLSCADVKTALFPYLVEFFPALTPAKMKCDVTTVTTGSRLGSSDYSTGIDPTQWPWTVTYVNATGGTGGGAGSGTVINNTYMAVPELTSANGALIASAIALVWAAGWVFRALFKSMATDEKEST